MAAYPALMGLTTHLWYSLVRKLKTREINVTKKYSCRQLINSFTLRVAYRDLSVLRPLRSILRTNRSFIVLFEAL